MLEERARGTELIENVITPNIEQRFPGYTNSSNTYEEDKKVAFYTEVNPKNQKISIIRFRFGTKKVFVEAGQTKITNGQIDFERPNYSWVAPEWPNPRNSWDFEEINQALDKLEEHLSGQSN